MTDSQILLRYLSRSIELGVLITITVAKCKTPMIHPTDRNLDYHRGDIICIATDNDNRSRVVYVIKFQAWIKPLVWVGIFQLYTLLSWSFLTSYVIAISQTLLRSYLHPTFRFLPTFFFSKYLLWFCTPTGSLLISPRCRELRVVVCGISKFEDDQ